MKKTVLIGTTAINRSVLHSDNMPGWYNYINSLDREKYDLRWIINVDYIEKLNEKQKTTRDNFRSIIKDIPIYFTNKNTYTGNFLQACKTISGEIEKYVIVNNLNPDDVIVFWLEDDWKLSKNNIPLESIIDNYLSNLTCVNFSYIRNNYIHALAPAIFNYNLWKRIHLEAWKNQTDHTDPEHCVGVYYQSKYGLYKHIQNVTVINNKYKKISRDFIKTNFETMKKTYYSYYDENSENIFMDSNHYLKKNDFKNKIKNEFTFVRITCSFCENGVNYGRDFMANYDIIKKRVQDNNNKDFYK